MAKKILSILCAVAMMVTMLSVGIVSVFAADDLGTVTTETVVTEVNLDGEDWYNKDGDGAWAKDSGNWANSCGLAGENPYGVEYIYGVTDTSAHAGTTTSDQSLWSEGRTVTLYNKLNTDAVFGDDFEFDFSIIYRGFKNNSHGDYVIYKLSDSVSIKFAMMPTYAKASVIVDGVEVKTSKEHYVNHKDYPHNALSQGMFDFWGSNATNTSTKYLASSMNQSGFAKSMVYNDVKASVDFKATYADGVLTIINANADTSTNEYLLLSTAVDSAKLANAKANEMEITLSAGGSDWSSNTIATYNLFLKSTKVVENLDGDETGPKYETIKSNINLDGEDWYRADGTAWSTGSHWGDSYGKAPEGNKYGMEYVYGLTNYNDGVPTVLHNQLNTDAVFGNEFEFNFSIAHRSGLSQTAIVTYKLSDSVSIQYEYNKGWPWNSYMRIIVDGQVTESDAIQTRNGHADYTELSTDLDTFYGDSANENTKYLDVITNSFRISGQNQKAAFDLKAVYKDGKLSVYNTKSNTLWVEAEVDLAKIKDAKVSDMEMEFSVTMTGHVIATYNLELTTTELREINDIPEQTFTEEEVFVNLDGEDWYNKENDKPWTQDEKNWTVSNGKASDNNLGVEYVYGVTDTSAGNNGSTTDQTLWSAGRTVTLYNKLNTNEVFGDNFEFTFSVVNRYKGNSHGDYVIYKLSDSVSIKFLMHSGNYALATIIVDGVEVATSNKHYINHKDYPHSPVSAAMFEFWGSRSQNTGDKFLGVFDRNYSWGDVKNASDFKATYADGVLSITNVNATVANEKNLVSAEVDSSKLATAKLNEMEITLSTGGSDWSGNTITTWGLGYKTTKVIPGPEYDENLKLSGATLVLGNGIGIEFQMKNDVYANYDNVTASVKYTGSDVPAVYELEKIDSYMGFTFDKYLPNQIDEQVYVTLYAEKDGAKYFSKEIQYSVAKYVDTMENKTQYEGLPEAVAALEEYCRATDAYVAGGEIEYNGETVALEETDYHFARETVADAKFAFVGCTINLRETPTVLFAFRTTEDINNYKFSATIDGKTNYVAASEFVSTGDTNDAGTLYYVYYKDVTVLQMETPVVGQIVTLDGAASSDAITYSVVSYAYYQQQKGNTSNLYKLTQALVAYGRAVANFENAQ